MASVGPPSKLTPMRRERLVALVRDGVPVETAVQAVGIHRDSFFAWMRRGQQAASAREEGDEVKAREVPYLEFADAVGRARAEAEVRAVRTVTSAMDRDWRAAAWYLERSASSRWSRRAHAEVDVVHHDASALEHQIRVGHQLRLQAEARFPVESVKNDADVEEAEIVETDG